MLPLVELPEIVRHYAPWFASVFSPEAFVQFQRYISGLIVSDHQTVEGINRIFVIDVRNQSRLNRWLTASPCSIRVYLRVFGPVGPVSENPELLVIPGFRDGTLGLWTTRTALSIHVWSLFDRSAQPGPLRAHG